ncbi:MAG: tetratricopeptide repeat protein [candidate division Zixibacteria bacterium]|nr:tetratricopeptide repeat protein [candidate division Zixibacteria bacterium]
MSPHRITKKEMKQDQFVTYSLKASEWIQKHLNQVLMVAGGVILVAVIVFFIFSSQAKRERKAAELLGKANLELQAGNIGGAVADLQRLTNQYGSTKSAGQASFLLASAYFYAKDFVQAQSMFEKYLGKYKEDVLLIASAQAGIADCHMQRGNFIQAGEDFVKAASLTPQSFLAPQYLLQAASAYLKGDQKDKAREVLNKLIIEYPDSREVHRAKIQLAENL